MALFRKRGSQRQYIIKDFELSVYFLSQASLQSKVLKILRLLGLSSEQPVASVTRQYSGAPVLGCRPVLVTFRCW